MRIIRIVHAGSVAFALSLPMVGLCGGCDSGGSGSGPTSAKETLDEAKARGKTIQDAYKTNPPDSAKKVESAGKK
jgi:hypothetical protein